MENTNPEIFRLTVRTSDKASENYIIDGEFNRVAKSIGEVSSFELPKGLYSVKVKVGLEFIEKPVILTEDQEINFEPVMFNSPAPLQYTAGENIIQCQAATDYSKKEKSDVTLGVGSKLFLFGTIPPGIPESEKPTHGKDPAIGLTLRNLDDKILIDFGNPKIGYYTWSGDPWAACDVEITPGTYTLCLETKKGDIYRLNVITSPGWQTQVFLQPKNYGYGEKDVRADLSSSSIFMSKVGHGFDPLNISNYNDNIDFRLTEQIRKGLTTNTNVVSKDLMGKLFSGNFENPMLGIYAAHLLLLNNDFRFSEIKMVVENLRGLLGNSHPDVEAIALKMGLKGEYVFKSFPMLANSWRYILEESYKNLAIIPASSQAYKNAGQFWSFDLWLVWGNKKKKEQTSLESLIEKMATPSSKENPTQDFAEDLRPQSKKITRRILDKIPFLKTKFITLLENLNEEKIIDISHTLGIPRSKVENTLKKIDVAKVKNKLSKIVADSDYYNGDPQKGKWGGKSEVNSRKLSAIVEKSSTPKLYSITLTVESTETEKPLLGEVKFHLHNTFLNPNPTKSVIDGKAVMELHGVWGSFTVGAESDNGQTKLELDLAELPGITEDFKNN